MITSLLHFCCISDILREHITLRGRGSVVGTLRMYTVPNSFQRLTIRIMITERTFILYLGYRVTWFTEHAIVMPSDISLHEWAS